MFTAGRERPTRLTNRNCCYSHADIDKIASTPDEHLDWAAFKAIFATSGCTATYDEQVYFLPLAIAYLGEHPADGTEYTADLVFFLSKHSEPLNTDYLLEPALSAVQACLATWTRDFQVKHYDFDACKAKGWVLNHSDRVINGEAVRELLDYFLRYKVHCAMAEGLVLAWNRPERSDIDAAWLLEYARAERAAYDSYARFPLPPHLDMTPSRSSIPIYSLINDTGALEAALRKIQGSVVQHTPSPTYWPDLIRALRLGAA